MVSYAATILVVEEAAAVQELIEQALRELGHRVLVTGDPLEALELARRVQIDLLVSDAVLLDRALLRKLRLAQPRLRVIHTSGGDGPDSGERDEAIRLGAPFSLKQLQEAVTASLDSSDERLRRSSLVLPPLARAA